MLRNREPVSPWQWCARLALAAAALALIRATAAYLAAVTAALGYPFGINYGEGIVWEQMRLIASGRGYGPIDGFPAIVFHYPPGYHWATALLAGLAGMDELVAGRAVSIGSTALLAALIAAIVVQLNRESAGRAAGLIGGVLGGATVFTFMPVQVWSYLMRVDMLSFALSFAGFLLGICSLTRPKAIYAAALLFVAAIYTKQTAIAAPFAVFAVMMFARPRTAWAGIATSTAAGLMLLAALQVTTSGEFLRHIVLYNVNRFYGHGLSMIVHTLKIQSIYIGAAAITLAFWIFARPSHSGAWRGLGGLRTASTQTIGRLMVAAYLALTTPMLLMATKSGSHVNYLIEWLGVIAIFVGSALAQAAAYAIGQPTGRSRYFLPLLALAIAVQAFLLTGNAVGVVRSATARQAEMAHLAQLVRAAPRPVISDDMAIVLRGGKPVVWEPAIFAELASLGRWDEGPLLAKIRRREFAFFITEGKQGESLYDSRYNPAVDAAMRAAYPVERRLAGYSLHFPAGPLPAYAADLR